ncbi:Mitochondrial import inner membrane translocase subunit TIM8 like protein [Verticillium longisporum]|uniref:Mitochondrial import inner membrane translocase subunit TIM8 like protein n=1 Tax=Verticillium longisporum TaxID=100787 RepID=A0A8I2ZMK9_VERLO|nr:Mitochondrial import inner membrane translocase subunit TIM8 like protein [Verticillium longisporum]KAG7133594.1 Mitochondrial import inner membrane translocase subunit TIM8 like protein [Verticillium longisporum]
MKRYRSLVDGLRCKQTWCRSVESSSLASAKMDASRQGIENSDLEKLNDKDKQELRQFLANESQRSQIQSQTHALTEICWKKCVTGSIRGSKLDNGEEKCLANCVDRFLDVNFLTMKHLNSMRSG